MLDTCFCTSNLLCCDKEAQAPKRSETLSFDQTLIMDTVPFYYLFCTAERLLYSPHIRGCECGVWLVPLVYCVAIAFVDQKKLALAVLAGTAASILVELTCGGLKLRRLVQPRPGAQKAGRAGMNVVNLRAYAIIATLLVSTLFNSLPCVVVTGMSQVLSNEEYVHLGSIATLSPNPRAAAQGRLAAGTPTSLACSQLTGTPHHPHPRLPRPIPPPPIPHAPRRPHHPLLRRVPPPPRAPRRRPHSRPYAASRPAHLAAPAVGPRQTPAHLAPPPTLPCLPPPPPASPPPHSTSLVRRAILTAPTRCRPASTRACARPARARVQRHPAPSTRTAPPLTPTPHSDLPPARRIPHAPGPIPSLRPVPAHATPASASTPAAYALVTHSRAHTYPTRNDPRALHPALAPHTSRQRHSVPPRPLPDAPSHSQHAPGPSLAPTQTRPHAYPPHLPTAHGTPAHPTGHSSRALPPHLDSAPPRRPADGSRSTVCPTLPALTGNPEPHLPPRIPRPAPPPPAHGASFYARLAPPHPISATPPRTLTHLPTRTRTTARPCAPRTPHHPRTPTPDARSPLLDAPPGTHVTATRRVRAPSSPTLFDRQPCQPSTCRSPRSADLLSPRPCAPDVM
ncbi:unnamed protein product [Arctogadus glacialis]